MPFRAEPPYTHGSVARTGVLLVNLGSPDAPTKAATRRYLAEFVSDPRVVEIPRWVWMGVLHGIILNTRPAHANASAANHLALWGAPAIVTR